jgi:hypothetical protein
MSEDDLPDLAGKFVVVYVSSPPTEMNAGVTLEFGEFRRMGGRLFLLGRLPEKIASEWVVGLQGAVAWDSVVHYVVFRSRDDYQNRVDAYVHSQRTLFQRLKHYFGLGE